MRLAAPEYLSRPGVKYAELFETVNRSNKWQVVTAGENIWLTSKKDSKTYTTKVYKDETLQPELMLTNEWKQYRDVYDQAAQGKEFDYPIPESVSL
jgi:hypothetical protein